MQPAQVQSRQLYCIPALSNHFSEIQLQLYVVMLFGNTTICWSSGHLDYFLEKQIYFLLSCNHPESSCKNSKFCYCKIEYVYINTQVHCSLLISPPCCPIVLLHALHISLRWLNRTSLGSFFFSRKVKFIEVDCGKFGSQHLKTYRWPMAMHWTKRRCIQTANLQFLVCFSETEYYGEKSRALQIGPSCHPGWENME